MKRRHFLGAGAALASLPFISRIALAEEGGVPQRGGILTYAVTAEPATYDLHANISFSVVHRLSTHYSPATTACAIRRKA
jgi:peptide/nickel transport system substrate-binding protein